jgi:thiamine biosynthesis protein ThiS
MITVNKKEIPFESGMTVHTALERRGYLGFGLTAVYINGIRIESREQYRDVQVKDCDLIQVIDFMGGG